MCVCVRVCVCVCVRSHFSRVQLFVTPWTIAHQAPLSMEFSRQEYWNELSCLPLEDFPYPGMELMSLKSPALAGRFFTSGHLSSISITQEKLIIFMYLL